MRDCLETADPNQHPCFGVNGDNKSLKVAQDQLLLGSLPGHAQTLVAEYRGGLSMTCTVSSRILAGWV